MRFLKALFGSLSDKHQPKNVERNRLEIMAASVADEQLSLQFREGDKFVKHTLEGGNQVAAAINDVLAVAPHDPDLLIAKYAALVFSSHQAEAREVLVGALNLAPNHLDGTMLRDHAGTWSNLFLFPPWSERATTLHPIMALQFAGGASIQLIRDRLSIGIAVLSSVSTTTVGPITRVAWKLFWTQTPHGPVAMHYALTDHKGDVRRQENTIVPFAEAKPSAIAGYWLLRRFARLRHCYLIYVDGNQVVSNSRYDFPIELRTTFEQVERDLLASGPIHDVARYRAAVNWYMQNSDFKKVAF